DRRDAPPLLARANPAPELPPPLVGCRGAVFGLAEALDRRHEARLAGNVLDESDDHADAGAGEAGMPVDLLAERPDDQRGHERADVDADVEDGEPCVAPR